MTDKEWADKKDKELREDIEHFIEKGVDKVKAFHLVTDGSLLGKGYITQMRHDYQLSIFD